MKPKSVRPPAIGDSQLSPQALQQLARLDSSLARRRHSVRVAGFDFSLETLDDLDAVTFALMAQLPAQASAASVAEVCPHFGVVWPSALALAEQLREVYGTRLQGLSLLELGCGLGIPSMVAKRLGASRVIASDRHPLVPFFLGRNAAANGVEGIGYTHLDWRQESPSERFHLVVGSDLLYEPWQAGYLANLLPRLLAAGGEALIADPGRRYVDAFARLVEAQGYACELAAVRTIEHGSSAVEVLVLQISKAACSVDGLSAA